MPILFFYPVHFSCPPPQNHDILVPPDDNFSRKKFQPYPLSPTFTTTCTIFARGTFVTMIFFAILVESCLRNLRRLGVLFLKGTFVTMIFFAILVESCLENCNVRKLLSLNFPNKSLLKFGNILNVWRLCLRGRFVTQLLSNFIQDL